MRNLEATIMIHTNYMPWYLTAVLALIIVTAAPVNATTDTKSSPSTPAVSVQSQPLGCFAFSIDWRSMLGNRRRIVQVTVIALCLGILLLIKPTNRI